MRGHPTIAHPFRGVAKAETPVARGAGAPETRRGRGPRLDVREPALDALMLAVAGLAAVASAPAAGLPAENAGWLIGFSVAVLALLALGGVYRPRFAPHFLDDVRSILGATAIAAMAMTFLRVLLMDDPHAAGQAVREWLFAAAYLTAGRGGMQIVQARRRRSGETGEPTLIVGAGRIGQLVVKRLGERPQFGLRPVAFLDDDPLEPGNGSPLPVVSSGTGGRLPLDRPRFDSRLDSIISELGVRHVVVTFSRSPHELALEVVRRCQELGVSVSVVPRLFEGMSDRAVLERLGGLPLVSVIFADPRGWQFAVKYALDRILAAAAIVLASPFMLAAALGTLVTLGRPVLLRQPRVGMDGREFDMFKFRTMEGLEDETSEAEVEVAVESGIAPGGVEGLDRRTTLGSFLRRTSVDELPQLFNVLRGEMSMIGPRPERPEFAHRFDGAVYRYADRHRVKSGITGWAQVHGLRGKTSLADRVEWDNYYIENWSLWLDLKILLLTSVAVPRDRSE